LVIFCHYISLFYLLANLAIKLVLSVFNLAPNGLALGEEADFEAQNCLPALNLIRSKKLHLSTQPAFLPNACYRAFFFGQPGPIPSLKIIAKLI